MSIDFIAVSLLCVGMGTEGYSLIIFDRLVRTQYERHREEWLADGGPRGILWRPNNHVRGNRSRTNRVSWSWLFRTPGWVKLHSDSMKMLTRYRVSFYVLLAVVAMFLALLFAVLFLPQHYWLS